MPQAKGTAMPDNDDDTTARLRSRTRARFVSMPVSSSSSRNAYLRHGVDHALERLVVGKDHGMQLGQEHAEYRGAEHHARQ